MRSIAVSLLTLALAASAALAQEGHHQGVYFTTPSGWTSGEQDGHFLLAPADMTEATAVVVVLGGAEKLGAKPFNDWFRAKLASGLNAQLKVLQEGKAQSGNAGGLQTLSTGRTVQDAGGGVRLQIYHAVSDGKQAAAAMLVTASEAAVNKYTAGIQALFASLRFTQAPNAAAKPPDSNSAPPAAAATKSQIAVSDVAGYWTHSTSSYADYVSRSSGAYAGSSTIAYGQGYEFAADGTYQYTFTGMMNSVYIREKDSGTWGFEGGHLVIRSRERDRVKTLQIIEYKTAPDGAAFMTLLDVSYPPTAPNIGLYGEKFMRPAKKAAPK
jgi:hypothetical protein